MHLVKKSTIILSIVAIFLSFIASGNEINVNNVTNYGDTLIYRFRDAPVAPEYRRNYTITVTVGKVLLVVDSYEEIILKKIFSLRKSSYVSFTKALDSLYIKNRKEVKGEVCIGRTSESLLLYPSTSREVKGYINYCGGQPNGSLEGDVMTASNLFKGLIPGLYEKIEATIKDD